MISLQEKIRELKFLGYKEIQIMQVLRHMKKKFPHEEWDVLEGGGEGHGEGQMEERVMEERALAVGHAARDKKRRASVVCLFRTSFPLMSMREAWKSHSSSCVILML